MEAEFREFIAKCPPGQSSAYLLFRAFCNRFLLSPERAREIKLEALLEKAGLLNGEETTLAAPAIRQQWPTLQTREDEE